jgi:YggT family protein
MLAQAAGFLVDTATGLFALAFLLRFLLQAVRAPARNPLSHFIIAVTDFAVRPARRVIPGLFGLDLASLVLAWVVEVVGLVLLLAVKGFGLGALTATVLGGLALLAAVRLAQLFLYTIMVAIVLHAVLSWVNPHSPAAPLLNSLTRPLLGPLRKLVPPIANVDLSPLLALIGCQLLLTVPLAWAEAALTRLL